MGVGDKNKREFRLLVDLGGKHTRCAVQASGSRSRVVRKFRNREFPAKSLWNLKHLRGGLVDLGFIAQYLQLRHAAESPEVLAGSAEAAFAQLAAAGHLGPALAERLITEMQRQRALQNYLRLTVAESFEEESAPDSLKASLARVGGCSDFAELKSRLTSGAQVAFEAYSEIVARPAEEAAAQLEKTASP